MKILLFCFFSFCTHLFAGYSYIIQPRSYLFSTNYDIYSEESFINSVEKNSLNLHTIYSLYDEKQPIAKGTARLLSMGALLDSMKEIDIVDDSENKIGFIQGNWWTTAAGKFAIFDANNRHCANAFLDQTGSSVTLFEPMNERFPIAIFRRTLVPGGDYFWKVKVIKEESIDPRILHIFSAFITDSCWPLAPKEPDFHTEIPEVGILFETTSWDDQ